MTLATRSRMAPCASTSRERFTSPTSRTSAGGREGRSRRRRSSPSSSGTPSGRTSTSRARPTARASCPTSARVPTAFRPVSSSNGSGVAPGDRRLHDASRAPVPPEDICSKLDIPAEFGQKILDLLVNSKIIVRTSEPQAGFMPARDPANIKLSDIAEAAAATGFAQPATDQADSLQQIAQSQQNALAKYNLKQILDVNRNSQNN